MNDKTGGFVPRLAAVLLMIGSVSAQGNRQILHSGAAVTQTITASEQHRFEIAVQPSELIKVIVDQQNADVRLELSFAGAPAVTVDDPEKRGFGRELFFWVAPAAGSAEITVTAKTAGADGRYTITASVSAGGDGARDAVAFLDAARRTRPVDGESRDAAPGMPPFQRALDAWRAIGDRDAIAASLYGLGTAQRRSLGRPVDAVTTLTEALAIYSDLELHAEMAQTQQQIGHAQRMLAHPDLAIAAFEQAYEQAAFVDPLNRAVIEDDIGLAAADTGDLERAAAFGRKASDTFRAAGARRDEFVSLQRLAMAYLRLRQFDDALRTITEALELGRQYGGSTDLVSLALAAGRIAAAVGEEDTALAYYRSVVDRSTENRVLRLSALLSIGRIHNMRGDLQQARAALEPALAEVPPQITDMWAAFANELGITLAKQGELPRALELQTKALGIVEKGSRAGEMVVLRGLAATYRDMGNRAKADDMTNRAANTVQALPGQPVQAALLRDLALNALAGGDLAAAREKLAAAIAIIDSERGRLQSEALRTSFGATASAYYTDAIDVEMALHAAEPGQGHEARAFELFERSRARSLVDLLTEARVDPQAGVDAALLAEQRAVQKQLANKDTVLRDLAGRPGMRDRMTALSREIDDLERRLAVLDGRIRASNPQYAALLRPAPPSIDDTQRLLDADTVLLAFAMGAKQSWGWAVTRESIRSFVLPPAAEIDERAHRVYASVTARQRRSSPDATRLAELDREEAATAAALSDAVLGPIAGTLATDWRNRRLVIVATGALEYVPFAALPLPSAAGRRLIVEQHEVIRLPSVATLALLRRDAEGPRKRPSTGSVAIFADPVFSPDDPRVTRRQSSSQEPPAVSTASLLRGTDDETTRTGFARLVFSREEASAIAGFAPHAIEALDFNASVPTLSKPAVAGSRILHIASHGILNSARPALSGIVLSLVDQSGRRQDGILRLYDIFNLSLSADLVVLSGCQTGLGREIKGEGLIGLTRGFMYAGAARVLASLWEVDDRATAELMRRFYRGMLVRKLRPADALRTAQQQMRTDPRWRSPYYWAGFTLVGDWQ
jgi:CHAT domain-containing protein/tetratricopeptide (TPR) repeat protein